MLYFKTHKFQIKPIKACPLLQHHGRHENMRSLMYEFCVL